MGMASSDDDMKIMEEYYLMQKIKEMNPSYGYDTHGMSDDARAIHDADLRDRYLGRGAYDRNQAVPTFEMKKPKRGSSASYYEDPVEDEQDKKIKRLEKEIKIAELEKKLASLKRKK